MSVSRPSRIHESSSQAATVQALSKTLTYLYKKASKMSIELLVNLYLSKPPSPLPTSLPHLPNATTINPYRPEVAQLVRDVVSSLSSSTNTSDAGLAGTKGLAVVACGPEGIVLEARNAIASLGINKRVKIGGVDFHGECYAL